MRSGHETCRLKSGCNTCCGIELVSLSVVLGSSECSGDRRNCAIACHAPAGVGKDLRVHVRYASMKDPPEVDATSVSFSYAAPRVDSVRGRAAFGAATRGGELFTLVGAHFGPPPQPPPTVAAARAPGACGLCPSRGGVRWGWC